MLEGSATPFASSGAPWNAICRKCTRATVVSVSGAKSARASDLCEIELVRTEVVFCGMSFLQISVLGRGRELGIVGLWGLGITDRGLAVTVRLGCRCQWLMDVGRVVNWQEGGGADRAEPSSSGTLRCGLAREGAWGQLMIYPFPLIC